MNYKNFEEFLGQKHMEEEPMVLDDDLPDAFDNWVSNQSADEWIALGDEYVQAIRDNAVKIITEGKEAVEAGGTFKYSNVYDWCIKIVSNK